MRPLPDTSEEAKKTETTQVIGPSRKETSILLLKEHNNKITPNGMWIYIGRSTTQFSESFFL